MHPIQTILDRLQGMASGFVGLLPQIAVALLLLVLTWLAARYSGRLVTWSTRRSRMRRSLVDLLQNLAAIAIWIGGLLLAATIAFPDMSPTDLLATIGLGSIAIGFAFKDVFENFVAGIFILFREPMRMHDHIECEDVEGQVVKITVRDTHVRRTDGQLVVLPNAMLLKNPVTIRTDWDVRRVTVMVGVAYGEDVDAARDVIERAVRGVDSIVGDRPVQIFAQAFGASSIDFEVTWWTGSKPVDVRRSRDEVVAAVKRALDDAGIEIPFPYRTLTFKEPLHLAREARADERA
ncbi:MAG: mechanosensitive ion channel family protein [Geminicoccaceae bacterium]|nr:mechanosensitive ion channel family protein [Geminicoccaceae bacterium]